MSKVCCIPIKGLFLYAQYCNMRLFNTVCASNKLTKYGSNCYLIPIQHLWGWVF